MSASRIGWDGNSPWSHAAAGFPCPGFCPASSGASPSMETSLVLVPAP